MKGAGKFSHKILLGSSNENCQQKFAYNTYFLT